MKLKYTFETMELDGNKIAVPVGNGSQEFRGVIRLNESAEEIFDLFKENTTVEDVIKTLKGRHGDDPEISSYVNDFVNHFTTEGVLE